MAEVVVLGSGTSNGVPMLGVRYPREFLENPRNHRTRPSILVCGPKGNLLVDCAPELRLQLLRESVFDVEAVVITHAHADHIMGMDDLRSFCVVTRRAMPVYSALRYHGDIRRIFAYAFAEYPPGIEVPRFDLRALPETLEVGGLVVQTMSVMHGTLPIAALRVNDFAYVTDVSEIPAEARSRLKGLDVLMLDAVRLRPHPNHFHLEKAVEVAQEIGARQTYFTHLSHDYDHDRTNAELPAGIALAYDGLRIPL